MQSASENGETSTESAQATPDQITPVNDKVDSAKLDNEDDGLVGSSLQITADEKVTQSLH